MSAPTYYGQLQRRIADERNDLLQDSVRVQAAPVHYGLDDEPAGFCWEEDHYPDDAQKVTSDVAKVTCPACLDGIKSIENLLDELA